MKRANDEIKAIVGTLNVLGRSMGAETVFRDWCACSALAIANGCDLLRGDLWKQRESRYMEIIGKYKDDAAFAEMLAHLVQAFEIDPWQDHLGRVYMECFGGNKRLGQCFTPIEVCEVCAEMCLPDKDEMETRHKPVTIADECCGGGAMLIAACKVLHDRGVDWQRSVQFHCADLDSLCVHMCYVQLSLLGARAIVKRQDTILMRVYETFVSPMEMLWPMTVLPAEKPCAEAGNSDENSDEPDVDLHALLYGEPEKSEGNETSPNPETLTQQGEAIQLKLF